MRTILLVGLMGTGKTSVGVALAKELKVDFVDIDCSIEKCAGMTLSQYFEKHGERYFRQVEKMILKEIPLQRAVVASGGGAVILEESRKWMQEHCVVVLLTAKVKTILDRLKTDETRPLLQGNKKDTITSLLRQRKSLYAEVAQITISTDYKSVKEIVSEIVDALEQNSLVKLS